MRTIEEIRRLRLVELRDKYKGIAELNEARGKSRIDSTLTQIVNGSVGSKTGKPKTMGSELARSIEEDLKLERGWMDNDPDLLHAAAKPGRWPFYEVDARKIAALDPEALNRLEGAMLLVAAQLGKDIAAHHEGKRKAA